MTELTVINGGKNAPFKPHYKLIRDARGEPKWACKIPMERPVRNYTHRLVLFSDIRLRTMNRICQKMGVRPTEELMLSMSSSIYNI